MAPVTGTMDLSNILPGLAPLGQVTVMGTNIDAAAGILGSQLAAAAAIAGGQIANATITGAKLVNNTVTATQIAAHGLGAASIAANVIQQIQVPISSAQILALYGTPLAVIPAPGAGKSIQIIQALFRTAPSGTAYANGGVMRLQYHTGPVAATGTIAAAVVISGTASDNILLATASAPVINDLVEFAVSATGEFITGTGTALIDILYRIV